MAEIFVQKYQLLRMFMWPTVSRVTDDFMCDTKQPFASATCSLTGKQLPRKASQSRTLGLFFSPLVEWTRIHGNSECQQVGIKFCSKARHCVSASIDKAARDILHASPCKLSSAFRSFLGVRCRPLDEQNPVNATPPSCATQPAREKGSFDECSHCNATSAVVLLGAFFHWSYQNCLVYCVIECHLLQ